MKYWKCEHIIYGHSITLRSEVQLSNYMQLIFALWNTYPNFKCWTWVCCHFQLRSELCVPQTAMFYVGRCSEVPINNNILLGYLLKLSHQYTCIKFCWCCVLLYKNIMCLYCSRTNNLKCILVSEMSRYYLFNMTQI